MKPVHILIAEDHSITRRGLASLLTSANPKLEIVEAGNGREAIDLVTVKVPDVIIMDMVMPHLDGARATQEIKIRWPQVRILLLLLDSGQGQSALEAGADAYLLKDNDPAELLEVLNEFGINLLEVRG